MASDSSKLEDAIELLVRNFYKHAGGNDKMNREEFRKIITQDLHHILTYTEDKEAVDKLIKSVDKDKDKKISFDEYWTLIGMIAKMLSQYSAMQCQE
ncbi:protein S100-A16-like [Pelobates fuscus]|uniref:protein S100-A16-like n=1 Tax=Pelobates fuscus TaxID=191477 RepID=UPI002FE42E5B